MTNRSRMSQATVTIIITVHQVASISCDFPNPLVYKFVLHKAFICYYSPFFSAAFNGKFEEGNTQKMELNDVDPKVFGILANWLYSQEVTDAEKKTPDLVTCAKLWILGDRFLMRKLQNDAMRQIYGVLSSVRGKKVPAIEFGGFCRIAANTKPEDNPLVKIAVSMLSSTKKIFDNCADEIPYSILLPVSKNLILCREKLGDYVTVPHEARWGAEGEYFVKELAEKELA